MIVGFASMDPLGCTFLNWSLHWLSGDKNYWNESSKGWLELCDNPLTDINSHFFKKNHPNSIKNWQNMIDCFCSYNHLVKDYAFYGYVKSSNYNEFQSCISYVLNKKIKLIFLGCDYPRYTLVDRSHDPSLNHAVEERNIAILKKIKEYFHTVQNLESLIDTPGKARKFLSLCMKNLRREPPLGIAENFLKDENFVFINVRDLLNNGKEYLISMFKFLDREIDTTRMENWLAVYLNWRKFLLPTLNFYDDLPKLLYSIVHGDSLSLTEYKLDIFTEAIIQHELMVKYGTRLLVEHLDHFPDNAKELTQYLKVKK